MLTGACLCGAIAFEIDGDLEQIAHCHCSMCRKFHGSAFATFGVADPAAFRWLRGAEQVQTYAPSPGGGRGFCPICGSAVPSVPDGAPFALIPLGNVSQDPEGKPIQHFFVASKAPWHDIVDDLQQFDEFPPEFGATAVQRPTRTAKTPGATGGSCLCGAVTYEYDGPPARMVNCHCSRCRRALSSAYGTFVAIGHDAFRWLSGEDRIVNYKMPEAEFKGTAFCRECGGQVPRKRDAQNMQIAAGSLDDDPGVRPAANIFTDSRAGWVTLDPALPNHGAYPP